MRQGLLLRTHFTVNKTDAEDITIVGSPRSSEEGRVIMGCAGTAS